MPRPTGALKDIRKPDDQVRFYRAKTAIVPDEGDWSMWNALWFDQDHRNKCVGAAFGELMANDAARLGIIKPGLPLYYSTWYIYNWARLMRGWLYEDCGSYPEDAADAICEHGILRYDLWPCKRDSSGTILMDTTDPSTKESYARKYPNMVKARINNGVEGLLAALSDGVVALATPWFDKWDSSYNVGVLPSITSETMSGRHCFLLDGWSQKDGLFYGPNTWGEWGIQQSALGMRPHRCGFAMPFEYIELFKSKFGGYDAWDIDFEATDPETEMLFQLLLHAGEGGFGTGMYPSGSKVEIYAGKRAGAEFSRWDPMDNVDNLWLAKTNITMMDNTELTAMFREQQKKAKRCKLFDIAKGLQ